MSSEKIDLRDWQERPLSLPAADLRVNAFFPFFGITPALFFHIWEQTIHAGTVVENDRLP